MQGGGGEGDYEGGCYWGIGGGGGCDGEVEWVGPMLGEVLGAGEDVSGDVGGMRWVWFLLDEGKGLEDLEERAAVVVVVV